MSDAPLSHGALTGYGARTELWAESPHHIGTPTVVETSAKQMSGEIPEAREAAFEINGFIAAIRCDSSVSSPKTKEIIQSACLAYADRVTADLRKAHAAQLWELTEKLADEQKRRAQTVTDFKNLAETLRLTEAKLADAEMETRATERHLAEYVRKEDAAIARAEAAEAEAEARLQQTLTQSRMDAEAIRQWKVANDELRREVEALKADKARLDWLSERGGQWSKNLLVIPVPPPKQGDDLTPKDTTLREAIDAARKTK